MSFRNPTHTISYAHYNPRPVRISQKPPGVPGYVRTDINIYDTNDVITHKGGSSTFVNLIHAIDSRALLQTRYSLKKTHDINTHGIHDCFLCNTNDVYRVIATYNRTLLENSKLDIEVVLEGYAYPEEVRTALQTAKKIKTYPSPFCLMPT